MSTWTFCYTPWPLASRVVTPTYVQTFIHLNKIFQISGEKSVAPIKHYVSAFINHVETKQNTTLISWTVTILKYFKFKDNNEYHEKKFNGYIIISLLNLKKIKAIWIQIKQYKKKGVMKMTENYGFRFPNTSRSNVVAFLVDRVCFKHKRSDQVVTDDNWWRPTPFYILKKMILCHTLFLSISENLNQINLMWQNVKKFNIY